MRLLNRTLFILLIKYCLLIGQDYSLYFDGNDDYILIDIRKTTKMILVK